MARYEVEVAYQPDVERVTVYVDADNAAEAEYDAYHEAIELGYPVLDLSAVWATKIEEK